MNDHDRDKLLTELKTDMKWVKMGLSNHLQHHWMLTLAAWSAAVVAIGALIVSLIVNG